MQTIYKILRENYKRMNEKCIYSKIIKYMYRISFHDFSSSLTLEFYFEKCWVIFTCSFLSSRN